MNQFIKSLKPGDLLFTKKINRFLIDDVLWFFSIIGNKQLNDLPMISHVAIYIGNEEIVEVGWGGVRKSKAEFYNFLEQFNIYACRAKTKFSIKKLISLCNKELNKPFSFKKLIKLMFNKLFKYFKIKFRIKENDETYLCSGFVCKIFRELKIDACPGYHITEVSPLDLYNSKEFYEINRRIIEE